MIVLMDLEQIRAIGCKFNHTKTEAFEINSAETYLSPIGLTLNYTNHAKYSDNSSRLDDETKYFIGLHFLKYKINKLLIENDSELDNFVSLFLILRNRIVHANISLIYECLKRTRIYGDIDSMISAGQLVLIKTVEAFDPWRGYKFSTYCCSSILKRFYLVGKSLPIEKYALDNIPGRNEECPDYRMEIMTNIIRNNLANLTENEKEVLSYRFGTPIKQFLASKKHTLREIAGFKNLSMERIRQIERAALRKIKKYVSENKCLIN